MVSLPSIDRDRIINESVINNSWMMRYYFTACISFSSSPFINFRSTHDGIGDADFNNEKSDGLETYGTLQPNGALADENFVMSALSANSSQEFLYRG